MCLTLLFSDNTPAGSVLADVIPQHFQITLSHEVMTTEPSSPFSNLQVRFSKYTETGLVSWIIQVVDTKGKVFRTWQGNKTNLDQFPSYLQFNGLTDQGERIPDGSYRFNIKMEYSNGGILIQNSSFFTVVSQKPSGLVRVSQPSFSLTQPEGILLYHDLSSDAEWIGFIVDTSQKIIKKIPIGRNTEAVIRWQGDTDLGSMAKEGDYLYYAEGINSVGLIGRTLPVRIRVDPLRKGALLMYTSTSLFSGLSSGKKVTFTPHYNEIGTIKTYKFTIRSVQNDTAMLELFGTLPSPFVWDGRDSLGILCPDGTYKGELELTLVNGSTLTAASGPITLDSTPPYASVSVQDRLFSPNDDGIRDTTVIVINAEGASQWSGSIINPDGVSVRSFLWKDNPPRSLIWNGQDEEQRIVPDGSYRFILEGFDPAGNRTILSSDPITVDTRKPSSTITSNLQAFSPNQDGFADKVTIQLFSSFTDGLEYFVLEIRDKNGNTLRRLAEGVTLERNAYFEWDGSIDAAHAIAKDGEYIPWAQLKYTKGDRISLSGKPILLDRNPPSVSISISPAPLSSGMLSISISSQDVSEINGWKLSIFDAAGTLFTSFSGKAIPREPILWNGYNLDMQLIDTTKEYSYILQVRDILGNMATKQGILKPKK